MFNDIISKSCGENKKESNRKDRFMELITKAPFVPGHQGEYVDLNSIPWVDHKLLKEGIEFVDKYYSAFALSTLISIFLGVVVKPISAVFFRVGTLHDPQEAYQRMVRTFSGVEKFYQSLLDPNKCRKQFEVIRKMHAVGGTRKYLLHNGNNKPIPEILWAESQAKWKIELAQALRKDFENFKSSVPLSTQEQEALDKVLLTWSPVVPISQFDMVATAFSAFGAMWISPKLFGIKGRDKEFRGIIHLWAAFAKLLGVQDEFNVFIDMDSELVEKIFGNMMITSFKNVDETVITLQHSFAKGVLEKIPGFTYKGVLYQGLTMREEIRCTHLWSVMGWKDKFCAKYLSLLFWLWAHVPGFLSLSNFILKSVMGKAVEEHVRGSRMKRKKA